MQHRWSGWPGAWCLDCGREDPMETALADGCVDDEGKIHPDAKDRYDFSPCKEPGSKRFDPYAAPPLDAQGG